MGTFYGWKSRSELLKELREDDSRGGKIIASKVVGAHHWYVLERDGKRVIGLDLISRNKGDYGYKPLSETVHPYHYDCPIGFLELAQPMLCPNEYALAWRDKVREVAAAKKCSGSSKKLGDLVEYGGHVYRLTEYLGRKGWQAYRLDNGMIYRMKAYQAKEAQLVQPQTITQEGVLS